MVEIDCTHENKSSITGLCRKCYNIRWRLNNPEKYRNSWRNSKPRVKTYYKEYYQRTFAQRLQRKYGISLKEYNEMLQEQGNKCKICSDYLAPAIVDHCHVTNKVRGLLCNRCNVALGLIRDNYRITVKMSRYLIDSGKRRNKE